MGRKAAFIRPQKYTFYSGAFVAKIMKYSDFLCDISFIICVSLYMPQFKNNHTIPRCLIKEWAVEGPNFLGTHVYDYAKDKIYFSAGKGPSAYSFAIEPDIYVAQKDKKRIVTVEKWLGGVENTFSIFLREIKRNRGSYLLKDKKSFDLFLLALFSLRHRSKHNLDSIHTFLNKNPSYKEMISSENDENQDILVLENFIHSTIEEAMRFARCELIIARNQGGNLILGDRPFLFNNDQDDYSFIPISPYHLVSIKKINEPSYYYINETALSDQMVHNFNQMITTNSRQWIIATSEGQLNKYTPLAKVSHDEETPFYEPVQKLLHGYKLG